MITFSWPTWFFVCSLIGLGFLLTCLLIGVWQVINELHREDQEIKKLKKDLAAAQTKIQEQTR